MFSQCLSGSRSAIDIVVAKTFTQHSTQHIIGCHRQPQRLFSEAKNHLTIDDVKNYWTKRFTHMHIPEPVESIKHIIAHAIGLRRPYKFAGIYKRKLTKAQYHNISLWCKYRLSRMPLQYILKQWDFCDITIKLVPPIFIPRPETELLTHYVLKILNSNRNKKLSILDIGCGSGAISLALAHCCKRVKCVAVDVNAQACNLTIENRDKLGLKENVAVVHAELTDNGTFDVFNVLNESNGFDVNSTIFDYIVSNPPYIPTAQLFWLPSEIIDYEDITALDGGHDGLKVIKPLLKYAAGALKPGGHLLLEVDATHPQHIQKFIKAYPDLRLLYQCTHKDFCNVKRFVQISKLL